MIGLSVPSGYGLLVLCYESIELLFLQSCCMVQRSSTSTFKTKTGEKLPFIFAIEYVSDQLGKGPIYIGWRKGEIKRLSIK